MKKKLYLLLIILLLQVDAFGYAKKIVLASFKPEDRAHIFLKQVNKVIMKDKELSTSLKINNIAVNVDKINNYYIVSIKVFQDKDLLLKTIKTIRHKYKDAYIEDTVAIPKKEKTVIKKIIKKEIKVLTEKKVKIIDKNISKKIVPIKAEKSKIIDKETVNLHKEKRKKSSYKIFSSMNIMIVIFIIIFSILLYYFLKLKKLYDQY